MILKGKKVVLRPVKLNDAARFVKWFNDPEVNKFLLVRKMSLKNEISWIELTIKNDGITGHHWSIDAGGEHVGSCGIRNLDQKNKKADIGIMIGNKNFWNQGLGTEVMALIMKFAFKKRHLSRGVVDGVL